MQDETEARILEQARAGDARALGALIERHQAQVYRFGMKMCGHPEDAKDVLQETLLSLARGIRDFRGGSSLSTWLFAVARSHCIKKRRRSRRAAAEVSLEDEAGTAAAVAEAREAPDEAVAGKQVEQALDEALGALAPMYREVLVLRDVEGLSAAEVAQVVGVSVDAVKSRLHRARLAVRAHLAPLLDVPAEPAAPAAGKGACPDVMSIFSRRLEGEISSEACAEMERHLQACSRCRGACDSLRRTLLLCRTVPSAEVPPAVQTSVRVALRDFLGGG